MEYYLGKAGEKPLDGMVVRKSFIEPVTVKCSGSNSHDMVLSGT